ncbi:X2-like carbohydrate binding domain-containing protein [Amygdalobacter indicium]|uniref:X2-like carbohydrate binding domain-containing protein n=1 Tax=Amygdalobacter indicium TaxID=3029272 RepID=UPI00279C2A1C|nr:X2-like carbohydrate binding domain-containing protein [Amygdalobacter indicium]WEG34537.1 X2-like carbohydrate binding domain-containing protein [Amygdalobacter indicium]
MKRSRLTVSILSLSLAVLVGAAGIFGGAEVVVAAETQTAAAEQTVKVLKQVKFTFQVNGKDYQTREIAELYQKGDKYGLEQNDIQYTVAQIIGGLLAGVQNDIMQDNQGNLPMILDNIKYPETINDGENKLTLAIIKESDLTDAAVESLAASGISPEQLAELLQKQNKKISPRQMQLFSAVPIQRLAALQKLYKEAVESAQLIAAGKVQASDSEKAAAAELLQVKASFGNKEAAKFTEEEIKKAGAAATTFNSKISATLKAALQAYKENPTAEGQENGGNPAPVPSPAPAPAPTDTTETQKVTSGSSDKSVELLEKTSTPVTPDNPFMARFAAEPSDLTEVEVDGEKLNRGLDYTVTHGSTVITLTKNYLQTLTAGEHTLTAVFSNGVGSASFVLAENLAGMKTTQAKKQVAKTGELATSVGAGFMGIISLLGAAVIKGKKDKLVK